MFQLVTIMWEQHNIPHDHAHEAAHNFLYNFRLCPDNEKSHLDEWRHLLWTEALGDEFSHLAGEGGQVLAQQLQQQQHQSNQTQAVCFTVISKYGILFHCKLDFKNSTDLIF